MTTYSLHPLGRGCSKTIQMLLPKPSQHPGASYENFLVQCVKQSAYLGNTSIVHINQITAVTFARRLVRHQFFRWCEPERALRRPRRWLEAGAGPYQRFQKSGSQLSNVHGTAGAKSPAACQTFSLRLCEKQTRYSLKLSH